MVEDDDDVQVVEQQEEPQAVKESFDKIAWVPFTRICLLHPKVRHELGQTKQNEKLEDLQKKYKAAAKAAEAKGLNGQVFNAEIPEARRLEVAKTHDAQVKALVERKAAFSASGIFQNVGRMVVNAPAVTEASRILLEQRKEKKDKAQRKLELDKVQREQGAAGALAKHNSGEKLKVTDWKKIIMFVLPKTGSKEAPSSFNTLQKIKDRLEQLDRPWWEYVQSVDEVPTAVAM